MKPEPQTVVPLAAAESHNALNYLQGKFISIAAACAFVLDDPITECSRNETPLAIPSWRIDRDSECQGRWRRYTLRTPYLEDDIARPGYHGDVDHKMLHLSILLATFSTFCRYFGDARAEAVGTIDNAAPSEMDSVTNKKPETTIPQQLNRYTWDGRPDDPSHPHYNRILSELLPGNRLVCIRGSYKTDVARKLRNGRLQFPRFWEYDLSTKVDANNIPVRSRHFQQRLLRVLSWWSPDASTIAAMIPIQDLKLPAALEGLAEILPKQAIANYETWFPDNCQHLSILRFIAEVLPASETDRPEHLCRTLESCFIGSKRVCACCQADVQLRCLWCQSTTGA